MNYSMYLLKIMSLHLGKGLVLVVSDWDVVFLEGPADVGQGSRIIALGGGITVGTG